jgi:hypothetical protein
LVMLQFLQRCWHREDETQQKPTQLQKILQGGESFVRQLRVNDGAYARGARRTLCSIPE